MIDLLGKFNRLRYSGFSKWRYNSYKWHFINKCLKDKLLLENFRCKLDLPDGFGKYLDERVIEYPYIYSWITQHIGGRILDAGSALNFKSIVSSKPIQKSKLTIMTLSPEKDCYFSKNIDYMYGDLRDTFFKADVFDCIISISTIEHIGCNNTKLYTKNPIYIEKSANDYLKVIKEFWRILRKGGVVLLTVPCGIRCSYDWLNIFDEEMIKRLIDTFSPISYDVSYYRNSMANGWKICRYFHDVINAKYRSKHNGKIGVDGFIMPGAEAVACIQLIK